nr:MAG TPA: hypothetical protein [Crassvirales sp.]
MELCKLLEDQVKINQQKIVKTTFSTTRYKERVYI